MSSIHKKGNCYLLVGLPYNLTTTRAKPPSWNQTWLQLSHTQLTDLFFDQPWNALVLSWPLKPLTSRDVCDEMF